MGEIMTISRVTRDGRGLHYDLQVLQQPERARACGSGPKCEQDYLTAGCLMMQGNC